MNEPVVEQTSSARKVRVQGSKESFYYGSINKMLNAWAQEQAKASGTSVLADITNYKDAMDQAIDFKLGQDATRAKLHLLTSEDFETVAWWRFGVPGTPFYVMLVAKMTSSHYWSMPHRTLVDFALYMPPPILPNIEVLDIPHMVQVTDANFSPVQSWMRFSARGNDAVVDWAKFLSRGTTVWNPSLLLRQVQHPHPHPAVKALLKIVQAMEGESTIQIPDISNPDQPDWLDLDLIDTNVNSEFVTDMVEFLDVDATVARIMEHYEALRTLFRSLGIEVGEKTSDDFAAAVISGDKGKLGMPVTHPATQGGGIDQEHNVSVHLPTGTIVVECTHTEYRPDVLEKWEEAKTIAALGGEEDELLAYARATARKSLKARTKTILAERKGMD